MTARRLLRATLSSSDGATNAETCSKSSSYSQASHPLFTPLNTSTAAGTCSLTSHYPADRPVKIPRPLIGREYVEKHPRPEFGNIRRRVEVAAISDKHVVCPGGVAALHIFARDYFADLFDGEFIEE